MENTSCVEKLLECLGLQHARKEDPAAIASKDTWNKRLESTDTDNVCICSSHVFLSMNVASGYIDKSNTFWSLSQPFLEIRFLLKVFCLFLFYSTLHVEVKIWSISCPLISELLVNLYWCIQDQ